MVYMLSSVPQIVYTVDRRNTIHEKAEVGQVPAMRVCLVGPQGIAPAMREVQEPLLEQAKEGRVMGHQKKPCPDCLAENKVFLIKRSSPFCRSHSIAARIVPVPHRFWAKVDKSQDCWNWMASKTRGYGRFNVNGNWVLAHRVSWELENGTIPSGLLVLHHCDNPSCVRINHLFLGNHIDNARDRDSKGRGEMPALPGYITHPERVARGERNGSSKLTEQDIRQIRELGKQQLKLGDIAPRFGITRAMVSYILLKKCWAHVL